MRIERRVDGQLEAPNVPLTGTLSSSDETRLTVPAAFTIPAGQSSVSVQLTGKLANASPVLVNATAVSDPSSNAAAPLSVSVVDPQLSFSGFAVPAAFGPRNPFRMSMSVPGSSDVNQRLVEPQTISVSISNAAPPNIVAGIYDTPANGALVTQLQLPVTSLQTDALYVGSATAAGSYQVRASISGNANSPWLSAVQTVPVVGATIIFDEPFYFPNTGLGLGFKEDAKARLSVNTAASIVVTLSSSPAGALEFSPAQITLGSDQSFTEFSFIARQLGPAQIIATGEGVPNALMSGTVVPARVDYYNDYLTDRLINIRLNGRLAQPVNAPFDLGELPAGSVTFRDPLPTVLPTGWSGDFYNYNTPIADGTFQFSLTIPGIGSFQSRKYNNFYNIGAFDRDPSIPIPIPRGTIRCEFTRPLQPTTVSIEPPSIAFGSVESANVCITGVSLGSGLIRFENLTHELIDVVPLEFNVSQVGGQPAVFVSTCASGCPYMVASTPITISVFDLAPANLVVTLAQLQTSIPADSDRTPDISFSANMAGTFKVRATIPGYGVFESDVIQVQAP